MSERNERVAQKRERNAIFLTVFGNLFMAALGLGFALTTRSQAILLDGIYSLIGFGLALLGIRVSALVLLPDDERYPFGYVAYEPILNFTKGILIGAVSIFALLAAIVSLITGGRQIAVASALVYSLVAAMGCFLIAGILLRFLRRNESPLVRTDQHNWLIDGMISLGVGVAFLVGIFLPHFGLAHLVPYVDPTVTAIICLAVLPIPVRIIRENWAQIVARSADPARIAAIEEVLDECLPPTTILAREVRVLESGRVLLVHLYLQVEDADVSECDLLRERLWHRLSERFLHPALDVSFTTDPRWFRHASGDL